MTLPPAASRGIVPCYRYAAGALISLALPLGRAQRPSSYPWLTDDMEGWPLEAVPRFLGLCSS